jgi:hypothetical protein
MYPVVIRSAVHAATRCALAITILLPEFKLENIACEEGKKRGSSHHSQNLMDLYVAQLRHDLALS